MKRYILLIPFLVFSLASQELDEAYLKSLPADIRNDVLQRMEEKDATEDPLYRRPSTDIDKEIDEDEDEDEESRIFGADFFDTMQSSFMPTNEPNLDSSYILDFGDVLEIQLIGQRNLIDDFPIARDGSINIPDIGNITLSGLSMSEASSFIKAKINDVFIGTEAFISLKNIRDINILIAGNAYNPGIYTLNGNSNMLHALHMAGGINEFGSYRNIELVRNGEVIDTLDIYKILVSGIYNLNESLRSGDSIVVNPQQKIVSFESGFVRKGDFEIIESDTFEEFMKFTNGFGKHINKSDITIIRIEDGRSKVLNLKSIDDLYAFEFKDSDSVYIREYKFKNVTIEGYVKNPGMYQLSLEDTLLDLINLAGGYENSAYPFAGYLENKKTLEINENAKTKLYNTFINNLIMNSSAFNMDAENIGLILDQIKDAEVTGRVIAEFDLDIIKNNPSLDTILEDSDRVIIPNLTQQVYIQGEISNPGALRYSANKDINYYINNAGGALDSADLKNVFIVHPNGETEILNPGSSLSFIRANSEVQLVYPGSIIYIPQTTNFANSIEVASIWAPIISSIALSLTSLSVLNNNN